MFETTISGPGFVIVGADQSIAHTLRKGRWAFVVGGRVVEIRLRDPEGFLPSDMVFDVTNRPEVESGWLHIDGEFIAPETDLI